MAWGDKDRDWPDAEPARIPEREREVEETEWATYTSIRYENGELGWHALRDKEGP